MACGTLTKGRALDCSRTAGGVKFIYFGVYDEFTDPISTLICLLVLLYIDMVVL